MSQFCPPPCSDEADWLVDSLPGWLSPPLPEEPCAGTGQRLSRDAGDCGVVFSEEREETDVGAGVMYKGQWKGIDYHGKGKLSWPGGETYEGEFRESKMHGFGVANLGESSDCENKCSRTIGSLYQGQWVDDLKSGEGIEVWGDGSKYQFCEGEKHGTGVSTSAQGDQYEGQFNYGLQDGDGVYTCAEGDMYCGQWKDGLMHGFGTHLWPGGQKYIGSSVNGAWSGDGTLFSGDGRSFRGQWESDAMHGTGFVTEVDGTEWTGAWAEGELICPKSPDGCEAMKR